MNGWYRDDRNYPLVKRIFDCGYHGVLAEKPAPKAKTFLVMYYQHKDNKVQMSPLELVDFNKNKTKTSLSFFLFPKCPFSTLADDIFCQGTTQDGHPIGWTCIKDEEGNFTNAFKVDTIVFAVVINGSSGKLSFFESPITTVNRKVTQYDLINYSKGLTYKQVYNMSLPQGFEPVFKFVSE